MRTLKNEERRLLRIVNDSQGCLAKSNLGYTHIVGVTGCLMHLAVMHFIKYNTFASPYRAARRRCNLPKVYYRRYRQKLVMNMHVLHTDHYFARKQAAKRFVE